MVREGLSEEVTFELRMKEGSQQCGGSGFQAEYINRQVPESGVGLACGGNGKMSRVAGVGQLKVTVAGDELEMVAKHLG